jgi:hypothetical protein
MPIQIILMADGQGIEKEIYRGVFSVRGSDCDLVFCIYYLLMK